MNAKYLRQPTLVSDLLMLGAQSRPEKHALLVNSEYWTYGALETQSNKIAQLLMQTGLVRGDRVLVMLPNGADIVTGFFGVLRTGGVACVLHYDMKASKLSEIARDSAAKIAITDAAHLELFRSIMASSLQVVILVDTWESVNPVPFDVVMLPAEIASLNDTEIREKIIDQDLAFLIYTSGSTGEAKGVMCPHAAVLSAVRSITEYLENTSEDVVVNVLPLAFDHGLYQVLTMFYVVGTLLLEKDFSAPFATLGRMRESEVTGFPGVPTIFSLLLRLRSSSIALPNLRYIASTGAPLPTTHIQDLRTRFPGVALFSMYGLTECKRASYLPPEELDRRPSSIGRGIPNEEVWLVNNNGQRINTAGEIGELVVRGSNVMSGYWNRPEETAKVFQTGQYEGDRVLYTGDLMQQDQEGFLYFVGRKDDLIKSRGEKVYPREVEDVLLSISGIVEVAVVGEADELLGEKIVAHVVFAPTLDISVQTILDICASKLERNKVPTELVFHSILPRTSSGKIDYRLLRRK